MPNKQEDEEDYDHDAFWWIALCVCLPFLLFYDLIRSLWKRDNHETKTPES